MYRNFICRILPVFCGFLIYSSAQAGEIIWSGFGSAFYALSLSSGLLPYNISNTKPDFTDFSLVGLNLNAKLADHWAAGAQLIALGDRAAASNTTFATFNLNASWAHVTYTEGDMQVRGGRQRFPVFTASEFVYEHYELPYREIPAIVFQMAPFVAFDGGSVSQAFDMGASRLNLQIFGGSPVLSIIPPLGIPVQHSNLLGGRINLEGEGWKIRVQASRSSSLVPSMNGSTPLQADSSYYSAGYRFDKYNLVSWGEYLFRHAPNGTITSAGQYLGAGTSGYILGGVRLGSWLPRYTFAQAAARLGPVGQGTTTTHTFGVNYYFNPKVAFKAEYELTVVPANATFYKVTQPGGPTITSGGALYAGLDFLM